MAAREAFITSATNTVMPVVRIDGKPIGDGDPGLLSRSGCASKFHQLAEMVERLNGFICQDAIGISC